MKVQGNNNAHKDSFINGTTFNNQAQNINTQSASNNGFNSTNPFSSVSGKQQLPKKDVDINSLWGNFSVSQKPSQQSNVFPSSNGTNKGNNFF